jgi:hypothetical protein
MDDGALVHYFFKFGVWAITSRYSDHPDAIPLATSKAAFIENSRAYWR